VKGGNYGWRMFEGFHTFNNPGGTAPPDYVPPVVEYGHSFGASVTGGYVYRGAALPSLRGSYVYADFGSGRIWALVHDGTQLVSNTEIADTTRNITSFGEDADGELLVCAYDGRLYRMEESGGGPSPAFPQTLSATGLFTNVVSLTPAPGLLEYDVNARLWSDGARKRRWLALPGEADITFSASGAWAFPQGTVLVKHFEIDVPPQSTRRLETRVLVHEESGWRGYTYRWNPAGTEANLLADGATETLTVRDPAAPGGIREQTWQYPSRADCLACHTEAAGRVLGLNTRQLNRDFIFPVKIDNQLRAWNHIGLFTTDIGDTTVYEAMPDPDDTGAPLIARTRAYLDANCAMCHRPGGPTPVDIDVRWSTPISLANLIDVLAATPVDGAPGRVRVAPTDRAASDLWERMRRTDAYGMPPLAHGVPHQSAVDLTGAWIDAGAD
jgi:uncharacterized repeat protein (TIGR03806 family)